MPDFDDEKIERYARQIIVPGIGAAGQRKLLAATALVIGDARGCEQASLYLRAAGVTVVDWPAVMQRDAATRERVAGAASHAGAMVAAEIGGVDVAIAADARVLDDATHRALVACDRPVCWYATDDAGFTSGVHPGAPLPQRDADRFSQAGLSAAVHDAGACDAASIACAILIGLPWRSGPFRFDVHGK